MNYIICDIDGTLANGSRRFSLLPDWEAVHADIENDQPYEGVVRLVGELTAGLIYLTGRPERYRAATETWLKKHNVAFHDRLLMRPDGDFTPDVDLKWKLACEYFGGEELLRKKVWMIIEDRDRVVEMWRNKGLFCIQPRLGDS